MCIEGRDIGTVILPKADLKFFFICNLDIAAKRRFKELKRIDNSIKLRDVVKSVKNRDKSDKNRNISKLKKTKDSILINTTNLTKKACNCEEKNLKESPFSSLSQLDL